VARWQLERVQVAKCRQVCSELCLLGMRLLMGLLGLGRKVSACVGCLCWLPVAFGCFMACMCLSGGAESYFGAFGCGFSTPRVPLAA
jgi:hypothetical protein